MLSPPVVWPAEESRTDESTLTPPSSRVGDPYEALNAFLPNSPVLGPEEIPLDFKADNPVELARRVIAVAMLFFCVRTLWKHSAGFCSPWLYMRLKKATRMS
jgi:hypothetical protein